MKREEYLKSAFDKFNSGKISAEAYDAILMNADQFVDEYELDESSPKASEEEPEHESLESQMFHAAMEQSAREASQKFKVAFKIQCSGKFFSHFLHADDRDCIFFSLKEAEDFCKRESRPYNRLGYKLTPVEVRVPVNANIEQKKHSTYKNMRFISSEER